MMFFQKKSKKNLEVSQKSPKFATDMEKPHSLFSWEMIIA